MRIVRLIWLTFLMIRYRTETVQKRNKAIAIIGLFEYSGTLKKYLLLQCCAILIGIGAISVLKSKIFDTFGIVSVLVLKEVS